MSISRRLLLLTGGALAITRALAAENPAPAPTGKSKKATYVLVHGGGHGGWCWERVSSPLRAKGHNVYTPTLTGLGERSHLLHPDIDLDTQITDVVNTLKWENLTNVILVGHSYGGMVITGVADRAPDRVGQLVYLDAAHPKNGAALFGGRNSVVGGGANPAAGGGANPAAGGSAANNAAAAFMMPREVNGVQLMLFPSEALIKGALGVTKPEDVAWLMDKLTPHPAKCLFQPLTLTNEAAVKKIPTTDIWRSMILKQLDPDGSKRKTMADRVWEINSPSHDLMVTDPQQVTDMLLKLASI
jgi:pimeloyl-ACP methyl ester carboxylesterase